MIWEIAFGLMLRFLNEEFRGFGLAVTRRGRAYSDFKSSILFGASCIILVFFNLIMNIELYRFIRRRYCLESINFLHSFYESNEKSKEIFFKKIKGSKNLGKKNEKISKLYR